MLSIIYNGIKPNEYKFEYSVIDNNKVDYIDFSFDDQHAGTPFVKIESKDKKYVDKINVSEYASSGHIIFPLLSKTTAHKVIRVQLSFETSDTKWQTEVVEITLKNSVRAEEEIANNYPAILDRITHNDKKFVQLDFDYGEDAELSSFQVYAKERCRVAYTVNDRKCCKGQKGKWLDRKKGNHITDLYISGGCQFYAIINSLFGSEISSYEPFVPNHGNTYKNYDFPRDLPCCAVIHNISYDEIVNTGFPRIIVRRFKRWYNKHHLSGDCLTFGRIQFKFIKNFKWKNEGVDKSQGFYGIIADPYIDCLFAITDAPDGYNIYFYPKPRRF